MTDFWISFRITDDWNYQTRYRDLIKAISDCATGGQWSADTSCVCIRSEHNIDAIGQHLKKALNADDDHLVIRQIDFINTRYINEPGDGFLDIFPLAIKL